MNYYRMNEKVMELVGEICENIPCGDYNIHGEFIPVESLISMIEDLYGEVEHLKEEMENVIQDRDDNYEPVQYKDQIGYDIRW